MIKNVDFSVRRGEVVGIAGLMGAGRTEFAMSLFGRVLGLQHHRQGAASTAREGDACRACAAAIDAGLAYVTEDRKQLGLVLADDVRKNVTLASLRQVARARRDRRCRRAEGRRATTATGCGSAAPTSIRRPGSSRAATSRRSCCRNG